MNDYVSAPTWADMLENLNAYKALSDAFRRAEKVLFQMHEIQRRRPSDDAAKALIESEAELKKYKQDSALLFLVVEAYKLE